MAWWPLRASRWAGLSRGAVMATVMPAARASREGAVWKSGRTCSGSQAGHAQPVPCHV